MTRSRSIVSSTSIVLMLLAISSTASAQTEPQVRTLGEQDLADILVGSCIRSTREAGKNPATGESTKGGSLGGYLAGSGVVMVGVPAAEQWRSEMGIELMGPRHVGFDFDYKPIEELQAARKLGQQEGE